MGSDLGNSIILTMAPIVVLMIGLVVYGIMKNSKQKGGQSKREADAIIEAQAMLAKLQKEQQNKSEETKKSEEKSDSEKEESKNEDKPEKEAKSENKKSDKKSQKPTVSAPVEDTTELEPDIDKSTNE